MQLSRKLCSVCPPQLSHTDLPHHSSHTHSVQWASDSPYQLTAVHTLLPLDQPDHFVCACLPERRLVRGTLDRALQATSSTSQPTQAHTHTHNLLATIRATNAAPCHEPSARRSTTTTRQCAEPPAVRRCVVAPPLAQHGWRVLPQWRVVR